MEEAGQLPTVSAPSAFQIWNKFLKENPRYTNGVSSWERAQAQIRRVFRLSLDCLTTILKSSANYLKDPRNNVAQYNSYIPSSKLQWERAVSTDKTLSELSFRHEGNAPELVGSGKNYGSTLMLCLDQKMQHQSTIVYNPWDEIYQPCDKLLMPPDEAQVIDGTVGLELLTDMDWHHKPTGGTQAEVQSNPRAVSPFKQQLDYSTLAIGLNFKSEPQNSQHHFNTPPYANSTKDATKKYEDYINNFKSVGELRDEASVMSKYQRPELVNALSSSKLSTGLTAPSMLSTLIDKLSSYSRIGSWALDGNLSDTKPLFADSVRVLPSLSNNKGHSVLTQRGMSTSNGSNSGHSEYRSSQDSGRIGQKGKSGKRKRSFEGDGNGDSADDENDENQKTPNRSSTEYMEKRLLACPFYKNDPAYFTADLFHDGKYFLCASRGFPDIARLKEHIYRKHSLPHTCSRCGDIFKTKSALDAHLPILSPEKITCEVRTLPPSTTKGLTPDMERELRNRSKNGGNPTMEAIWIDIYKKLFPGTALPSTGPYLTSTHGSSWGVEEKEEYIKYSEQKLPDLVQEELDATGRLSPEY